MKILSRYVAGDFIRYWLLCLTALVMLVLIASLFGNIDAVFSDQEAFMRFVHETAASLPTMLEYMLPITVLLAAAMTFTALSRTSEVVAMKAAGLGTLHMLVPMLLVCVPIAVLVYVNQHSLHHMLATEGKEQRGAIYDRWLSRGQDLYHVARADPRDDTVHGVNAFHLTEKAHRLASLERMESGRREDKRWHFRNITVRRPASGLWNMERVRAREVPAGMIPDLLQPAELDAHHTPFFDLYGKIRQLKSAGQRVIPYRVEWYQKSAAMAAPFLMVLLGAPLARVQGRRSGKIVALTTTIIAALAYIIVGEILLILGKGGYVPPLAAAWGLNAVFAVLGVFLVRYAR